MITSLFVPSRKIHIKFIWFCFVVIGFIRHKNEPSNTNSASQHNRVRWKRKKNGWWVSGYTGATTHHLSPDSLWRLRKCFSRCLFCQISKEQRIYLNFSMKKTDYQTDRWPAEQNIWLADFFFFNRGAMKGLDNVWSKCLHHLLSHDNSHNYNLCVFVSAVFPPDALKLNSLHQFLW